MIRTRKETDNSAGNLNAFIPFDQEEEVKEQGAHRWVSGGGEFEMGS